MVPWQSNNTSVIGRLPLNLLKWHSRANLIDFGVMGFLKIFYLFFEWEREHERESISRAEGEREPDKGSSQDPGSMTGAEADA